MWIRPTHTHRPLPGTTTLKLADFFDPHDNIHLAAFIDLSNKKKDYQRIDILSGFVLLQKYAM